MNKFAVITTISVLASICIAVGLTSKQQTKEREEISATGIIKEESEKEVTTTNKSASTTEKKEEKESKETTIKYLSCQENICESEHEYSEEWCVDDELVSHEKNTTNKNETLSNKEQTSKKNEETITGISTEAKTTTSENVTVYKEYIGNFKLTAYCNCEVCCGIWSGGATASGKMPQEGRTIAVDKNVIPLGTKVIINGNTYIAEDTGSAIIGNCIDIYFDSHQEATRFGVQYADVYKVVY